MKLTGLTIMTGFLFACTAAAQSQTGAQAGAEASAQTSVQAEKTQAQGSSSASANSSASAQNEQPNAALASGSTINAVLTAPIDSKKAQPGDAVTARTTEATKANGKTVIPRGSKLLGHITRASARAKGDSDSSLGILFDKAILKDGQEVPLNAAIQALGSTQAAAAANAGDDLATIGATGAPAAGSGRAAGTVTNTAASAANASAASLNSAVQSTTNATAAEKGAAGGPNATGQLSSSSRGVFGLQGVALNSAESSAAQGSVITSTDKNVHLDSGTQLLLVTQAGARTAPKP